MKRKLRNSAIVNVVRALSFVFTGTTLVQNLYAQNLVGKWNLTEGTYNGSAISNLHATFAVIDSGKYTASFDGGTNKKGYAEAQYTLMGGRFRTNINGNVLVLNGGSLQQRCQAGKCEIIWFADMSCSRTVFDQWGGIAIGYGNPSYSIDGDFLTLTSSDGKAVLKYVRESGVSVETKNSDTPEGFTLSQNYPNPFNPSTTITYSLTTRASVTLKVFDMAGREVATLIDEVKPAGEHQAIFRADHLTSGIYVYRLQAGNFIETRRMLLVK